MYAGKIVETANVIELFDHPAHPYTQALMKSIPKVEEKVERLTSIEGQPPPLHDLPPGCIFAPRCSSKKNACRSDEYPAMIEIKDEHFVSCWQYN
jgi:oligopeptide/dipeptide ABC transporter ATP-binding protein